MRTRYARAAVASGTAALAALTLAGCGTTNGAEYVSASVGCDLPAGAVAIVAAGRANAPVVDDTPSVVAAVNHAIEAQAHLTIIDTGGRPSVVQEGSLKSKAANGPAREDERRRFLDQVGAALQGVRSSSPEANPLDALGLAADAVRSHGPTGTVVLADSGLQTTGALDYTTPGMLAAEPSELVEQVMQAGQLPDLTGVAVALSGIGSTAQPQLPLDNATRERLQQQWVQLVTAAGAECVYLDGMPNSQPAPEGVPDVSEVAPPLPPEYDFSQPLMLREDVLAFKDNSPELRSPDQARTTLEPLVTALQRTSGTIHLTGTTASGGTENGRLRLSLQRAETVRQLLVDMGIGADRITTEGLGTNFPEFQNDIDESGNQIEELAWQNRSVRVTVDGG